MRSVNQELLSVLKAVLAKMEEVVREQDGHDTVDLECSRCEGGLGTHSLGCQVRNAIANAEQLALFRAHEERLLPYVVEAEAA